MDWTKLSCSRRTALAAIGVGALAASVPVRLWPRSSGTPASTSPELSLARFTPLVGSPFTVEPDGGRPARLTLLEAEGSSRSDESFSLIFGDDQPKAFDQGTHTVAHPDVGSFQLLVVPVGMGREGQRYQVIVNRQAPTR